MSKTLVKYYIIVLCTVRHHLPEFQRLGTARRRRVKYLPVVVIMVLRIRYVIYNEATIIFEN